MSQAKGQFEQGFLPPVTHQKPPGIEADLPVEAIHDKLPTSDGGWQDYKAAGKLEGKKALITGSSSVPSQESPPTNHSSQVEIVELEEQSQFCSQKKVQIVLLSTSPKKKRKHKKPRNESKVLGTNAICSQLMSEATKTARRLSRPRLKL